MFFFGIDIGSTITYIVATGYGRINVPFADSQITEITCRMRGVSWLSSEVRTVIDVGGQDCKGMCNDRWGRAGQRPNPGD